jgi:hypothetical protein
MSLTPQQIRMGREIVRFEGRYRDGKLIVYKLPSGDGGGAYEVAGINERHHREMARKLKGLIESGKPDEAETMAAAYIAEYTDGVCAFFPSSDLALANPGVEFTLRDCAFNRGPKGAAAILQIALKVPVDGVIGPESRAAFAIGLNDQIALIGGLTAARETYERSRYPWKAQARDESSKFWEGLANRWAKAHEVAHSFLIA